MITTVDADMTLDRSAFRIIAELAYRESGLMLPEKKLPMIQSRLRHRLRALKLNNFSDYIDLIASTKGEAERPQLISALTTNVSHFFREAHHFDVLRDDLLRPRLGNLRGGGKLRIWSAGCSNGQEALSAAICIIEAVPDASNLDIRILGTDIDPVVVAFARAGRYGARMIGGIPPPLLSKYFDEDTSGAEKFYAARPILQNMVRFNKLNLLSDWPMKCRFDAILCRNVVIYFDQNTQNRLWPRFHAALKHDGALFLGHSERIADPGSAGFDCFGPTSYRPMNADGSALHLER